jgi:hypothetical protein
MTGVQRGNISVKAVATVSHETLGKLSKTVSVKPKEDVKITFELAQK